MGSALPSDLWNSFVNGNSSCFRKLFKKYYKGMYGYGLKLCNDPVLVEDGIQELFESIWVRRDNLKHIKSPNVYLFVSLRRNILKARKSRTETEDLLDDSFILNFGAEEIIIKNESQKEQKKALQKALNQLSNQQKEVIYLHFYNGMSYSEIEEILSINRQSVRNHMHRAMVTLRTVLKTDVMRLVISLLISVLIFI
ncbi:MAG: sigma-70 family RNA polymerase sigma factor [Balneolaceae bacterium]